KMTEREYLFSLKKTAGPRRGGFTLIELMVVVAIIAVMTSTVTIGFHSFFSTINVQNVPGYIGDILHELSQEAILREYKESSVYFDNSYLLADSRNADADFTLDWEKVSVTIGDCEAGDLRLKSSDDAELLSGSADKVFSSVHLPEDGEICVDPLEYKERELVYNLDSDTGFSNEIRIFPLNLNLRGSDDIFLEVNNFRLDILQPYGQKKRYQGGIPLEEDTDATITVKSTDGEAKTTFNLPKK
ncbi:prepilin-type N-terminal cleavage/methylation domain-containing protein, partial [Patescibacteria group bacterium]|nr:prepilin-type N-terminal cleavage/methylation domain-containing protein [Patescibacteria group bacterium]